MEIKKGKLLVIGYWYLNLNPFVSGTSPWFICGGTISSGVEAGMFNASYDSGRAYNTFGFRIVLTPWNINLLEIG